MLAGVGPVPAVMFVVAADEGWQAQSEEHLRIADALRVRHGVVAVTKADRGDAAAVAAEVKAKLGTTTLSAAAVVEVSAATGAGLEELRAALDDLVASLPHPQRDAPVRRWVDRAFTIRGVGTVVTGTLPAGSLRVGDELDLAPDGRRVVVRGLESMKRRMDDVAGVARVAVNLRGLDRDEVRRGMALVTAGAWQSTAVVDVCGAELAQLPRDVMVHAGSAAVAARCRRLGPTAARLQLTQPLPLHLGDRLLVRDRGSRAVAGVDVADVRPRPIRRRGQAAAIGGTLTVPTSADDLLARSGVVSADELDRSGVAGPPAKARRLDGWWIGDDRWEQWRAVVVEVAAAGADDLESLRRELGAPTTGVVRELVARIDGLVLDGGRVRRADAVVAEPPGITALVERLSADPLSAPETEEVTRLDRAALAEAARRGRLLHLTGAVYVGPAAPDHAIAVLEQLPAPFSVSDARQALGVSRRVAVPLLEHLDARRRTRRLADGTRFVVSAG
jgi:selenocysteine-specific elongation factor